MAVVIHGRMTIRPKMLEETRSAAIQMGEASRADPGCNEYLFTQDLVDPAVLILAEEWASAEALQAHMATPRFASFSELLARVIAAQPDFLRFDASRPRHGSSRNVQPSRTSRSPEREISAATRRFAMQP